MINLPADVEPGLVELDVVVRQVGEPAVEYPPGSREWTRAELRQAGLLAEDDYPEASEANEEEFERLRHIFSDERSISDSIIEDRENRV